MRIGPQGDDLLTERHVRFASSTDVRKRTMSGASFSGSQQATDLSEDEEGQVRVFSEPIMRKL